MSSIPKINELLVYRKRREPTLGIMISEEVKKISIFSEDGKEYVIDPKKLVLNTGIIIPGDMNSGDRKLKLRNLRKSLEDAKKDVDIKIIWDCYKDQSEPVKFEEILELTAGGNTISDKEKLNLFWAIDKDSLYFNRMDGGYAPYTKQQVEKKLNSIKLKEEKRKKREEAVKRTLSVLSGEKDPDLSLIDKDFIDLIERYLIDFDKYERAKEAKDFLHEVGIKDTESAAEFLISIGIWDKNDDYISRKYFYSEFSRRSLEEQENILGSDINTDDFTDRTDLNIFSVDDEGTADIDDAISFQSDEEKLILGVHISNVAHYVSKEGFLDSESQNRAETVYLPEKVINMFPDKLVNRLLTLNAGEEKLVVSMFATFSKGDYELTDFNFEQSVIKLDRNITYEQAESEFVNTEWGKELIDLTNHLRNQRLEKGAFIVQIPELKITVEQDGVINARKNFMTSMPHKVISECMILMNRLSAKFFDENDLPSLYRTQLQDIDEDARHLDEDDPLFPTKVIKFLKPTRVLTECKPHKSLGIDSYVQITSPIRRYMDIVLQRQMISFLKNGDIIYSADELESINSKVSLNVRDIKNSQKSRKRFWFLKYLLDNNIETSTGFINTKNDKRTYVYIPEFLVDLPILGTGNMKYSEGQEIKIRFSNIDPLRRTIIVVPD